MYIKEITANSFILCNIKLIYHLENIIGCIRTSVPYAEIVSLIITVCENLCREKADNFHLLTSPSFKGDNYEQPMWSFSASHTSSYCQCKSIYAHFSMKR